MNLFDLEKEALEAEARSRVIVHIFLAVFIFGLIMSLVLWLGANKAEAGEIRYVDYETIAEAIYKAEGGDKAHYAYGIKSVRYRNKEHARQICVESVRNNVRRWYAAGKPGDFFDFMRNRYAPLSDADCNRHWAKNVRFYVAKLARR
jgi:hypothetical protein